MHHFFPTRKYTYFKMIIREATVNDSNLLTEISFNSKKYWNYPDEYFDIWRSELTITEKYIKQNIVFVIETDMQVVGYYSIVLLQSVIKISNIPLEKGYWLEHMFVLPEFIGQMFGQEMIKHFKQYCIENNIVKVNVLADPNAKIFYEKMGFDYIKEYPSTISGRTTPLLKINKFR